jgi:hypothetical protein
MSFIQMTKLQTNYSKGIRLTNTQLENVTEIKATMHTWLTMSDPQDLPELP